MVDGEWEDVGTGDVECTMLVCCSCLHITYPQADDTPGIVVRAEADKSILLQSKIPPGTETYLKQQGKDC
jgi:hypothetical protein